MSGGWRGATGGLWGSGVAGRCPVRLWLARSGSCGGVPGLADGAEEFVAGTLNGLGGVEVAGSRGEPVERFEGGAKPEEAVRVLAAAESFGWVANPHFSPCSAFCPATIKMSGLRQSG